MSLFKNVRPWSALLVAGLASGCGQGTHPFRSPAAPDAAAHGPSAVDPAALAAASRLTPEDLTARGWTCFAPPVPNRIVCSRPNQGFPTVGDPPPADRPASFTFLVFDGAGRFVGTETLIRTDLYNGQLCESTGEPYVFVPVIGYYECVHTTGQ